MIKDIKDALALERGAPNREEVLTSVRQESNDWVAKYRRWAVGRHQAVSCRSPAIDTDECAATS